MLKKILSFFVSLAVLFCFSSNAMGSNSYNWYFKTQNGESPILLDGKPIVNHPSLLALGNPEEKVIYLTFDAGYSTQSLIDILDTLKKEDVKAAFFILPAIYKLAPDVARRMHDEGHLVCNHSLSHRNMSSLSFEQFKAEVEGLEKEYRQYTGCNMSKFFRPPEGAFSDSTLDYCEKLGYKCVFWSFAYADWDNNKQPNAEKSKNKILSTAHNGEVLLLHPNSTTNAKILGDVIKELKQNGFTFETLYHLSEFKERK